MESLGLVAFGGTLIAGDEQRNIDVFLTINLSSPA